jgi:hypothetical protein
MNYLAYRSASHSVQQGGQSYSLVGGLLRESRLLKKDVVA